MKTVTIVKSAIGWRKGRNYTVADGVGNLLVERLKIAIDATVGEDRRDSAPAGHRRKRGTS